MSLYPVIVTTLGALALVATAAALGLMIALALPGTRGGLVRSLSGNERHPIVWAWVIAATAMGGSLYLSEIANLLPCSFCWYQRIAMYPLVLVLGIGILRGDAGVWRYALPLPVVGLGIALFHILIQWRPTLDVGACSSGAPCTARYVAVYGFVSIPTMAAAAFLLVIALMLLVRVLDRSSADEGAPVAAAE